MTSASPRDWPEPLQSSEADLLHLTNWSLSDGNRWFWSSKGIRMIYWRGTCGVQHQSVQGWSWLKGEIDKRRGTWPVHFGAEIEYSDEVGEIIWAQTNIIQCSATIGK